VTWRESHRFAGDRAGVRTLASSEEGAGRADSGHALEPELRTDAEQRLGHDFSRVRIHADEGSGASARALDAAAYTTGSDVVFAPGRYQPSRPEGRQLLFHELAHVVQQEGAGGGRGTGSAAEREAVSVSHEAVRGGHRRPAERSGAGIQLQPEAEKPAAPAPTWEQQINAAKAEADQTKKLAAMVQLVKQAVGAGTTVHTVPLSKTLDPAELKVAPVVNFDLNLNQKQSWPATKGAPTRQLSKNYGYAFNKGADMYIVLGPNALDARSPIFTEMYVQHELFHAAHHLTSKPAKGQPAKSDADEELEAWTNDFTNYFERLFQFRQQWAPLLDYYEKATAAARKTSLASIVAFYRAADPKIQGAVERWLKRRQADPNHASLTLVKDLAAALTPPAKTPAPAPTP
jgi:hypothetical protein